jgi:hypothetical protein
LLEIVIDGMAQQTLKWKLFPFSLTGGAKKWYSSSVGSVEGSWEKLREKFCPTFFPMSGVVTLRQEILSFKQLDKDSLGTAWARFTNSLASGPDIGILEPILLQHFRMGLDVESAKFMDTSSGGLFSHLTPSEGKVVLGKILENTPYTGIFDEFPHEEEEPKPDALSKQKPIEEKPTSVFFHEESLLYPRVYPANFSYDFDEESTYSDPLFESEFIEEEPLLEKFISTYTHPPLTKTWFTGEPFQPY